MDTVVSPSCHCSLFSLSRLPVLDLRLSRPTRKKNVLTIGVHRRPRWLSGRCSSSRSGLRSLRLLCRPAEASSRPRSGLAPRMLHSPRKQGWCRALPPHPRPGPGSRCGCRVLLRPPISLRPSKRILTCPGGRGSPTERTGSSTSGCRCDPCNPQQRPHRGIPCGWSRCRAEASICREGRACIRGVREAASARKRYPGPCHTVRCGSLRP